MVVFYHILYPNGLGADRWIYSGWKNAFEELGHKVYTVRNEEEIFNLAKEVGPDLLITYASLWNNFLNYELRIKNYGFRTAMFIDKEFLKNSAGMQLVKEGKLAGIYFGERSEEMMADFEKLTGQKYHLILNAADKTVYFPVEPVDKYKCDICFVGAYLPKKKMQFKKLLSPLFNKYDVKVFGPYWTWKDWLLLAGNKLFRKIKFYPLADFFNRCRLILPPTEENQLYSSAKICINLHERENNIDYDLINQRTFKILASGGFEICDNVKSLRKYFNEDELVMAKDDNDWFKKIDYYLKHDKERKQIQEKGTAQVLREHTYHSRVGQLLNLFS